MKLEMKGEKSPFWIPTTEENFHEILEITRTILIEGSTLSRYGYNQAEINRYSVERATWDIKAGKIVSTPVLDFRLAEGMECPVCGAKYEDGFGALSRRDNKTKICSPCGLKEALEDMAKGRNKK